jgi:hypothetical protein
MRAIALLPRLGPYLTGAGLIAAFLGLGWDVWMHATSHEETSAEDIFTLANPSHVLAGGGLVLAVLGVSLTLLRAGEAFGRSSWPSRVLAGSLVVVTAGVLAFGFTTATPHGHAEDAVHDEAESREETLQRLTSLGLSQEEIVLVETSREGAHTHDGAEFTLNASDVLRLAEQVEVARRTAERYRSIDTALREGYFQITQDLPLIGAHFISNRRSEDGGKFDLEQPEMIIYTFQEGEWRLYGLSYLTRGVGFEGEEPPEGFVGNYDVWHWHKNWCFTLRGAKAVSPEDCRAAGGVFVPRTGYMVHFWLVENPNGVFAHDHPDLVGSDEYIVPGTRVRQ